MVQVRIILLFALFLTGQNVQGFDDVQSNALIEAVFENISSDTLSNTFPADIQKFFDAGANPNYVQSGEPQWTPLRAVLRGLSGLHNLSDLDWSFGVGEEKEKEEERIKITAHVEILKKALEIILKAGADPNQKDAKGNTVLHTLCGEKEPDKEIIMLLFNNKADPNIKNNEGNTPLHIACTQNEPDLELVKLLLDSKADPTIKNSKGFEPKNYVVSKRNLELELISDNFNIELDALLSNKIYDQKTIKSSNGRLSQLILDELKLKIKRLDVSTTIKRDIPLSLERKKSIIKDFDTLTSKNLFDGNIMIYNNDAYEKLSNYVKNPLEDTYKAENSTKGNLFKGQPLSSPRKSPLPADPVGYFLYLPKDISKTEAVIVKAYGGNRNTDKPNTVMNLPINHKILTYLLSKNIGIMSLNTIDFKENSDFQGKMTLTMYERVLNNVKSSYDALSDENKRSQLSEKLKALPKKLPLYFYGASFGGALGVRIAQTYPRTFNAYISHDGGLAHIQFAKHVIPIHHVDSLKDNVLIIQNYNDNNTLLNEQISFYAALKKMGKASLVQLHFFPEANLTNKEEHNIGHFMSDESWYLQEYTRIILDFIEKTKNGPTVFTSPLPGSVQEMREFFHRTAFQPHARESSQFDRFVSTAFKIYKNALEWRDQTFKKLPINSLRINDFMKKWFTAYRTKNKISRQDQFDYTHFHEFCKKALDILSDDQVQADASWNEIYLNVVQEANIQHLDQLPGIIASLSPAMRDQLTIIYDNHRTALVQTIKKSRALGQKVVKNKIANAAGLIVDDKGNTALHAACQKGLLKAVKFFLRQGADPNSKNLNGGTPLHMACARHTIQAHIKDPKTKKIIKTEKKTINPNPEIIKLLLAYSADPNIKNKQGKAPGDLTQNHVIKDLLKAAQPLKNPHQRDVLTTLLNTLKKKLMMLLTKIKTLA